MSKEKPDFNKPVFDLKEFESFKVAISQTVPFELAFGNMTVTDYELLTQVIYLMNKVIDVTNKYTTTINEVLEWLVEDGLREAVLAQLNIWLTDGTLEQLINDTLFKTKLDKVDFELFVVGYESALNTQEIKNEYYAHTLTELANIKVDEQDYEANKIATSEAIATKLNKSEFDTFKTSNTTEFDTFKTSNTTELNKKSLKKTPTFSFIFDSGFADAVTTVADSFLSRNLQCGYAIAIQEMGAVRSQVDRVTYFNSFLKLQKYYGFDLLPVSLRHGTLNNSAQIERARNEIVGAKDAYQKMGIPIAGWQSPSSVINGAFKSMLKIYSYAYDVYEGAVNKSKRQYFTPNDDRYLLSRIHLGSGNTLNDLKWIVDETIKNNGFLTFYGHTTLASSSSKDFELANLNAILDYIILKGGSVQSPNNAVAYFFGSNGYVTHKSRPTTNLIDLSKASKSASNAYGHLYIDDSMTVVGNAIEINIDGNVTVDKEYRLIYNLPKDFVSSFDFTSQIYTSVEVYDDAVTDTRANVTIKNLYTGGEHDSVVSSLWREPQTYESLSYPPNQKQFASGVSVPIKVQIDVKFTGGRTGAKIILRDLFIGICGQ